MAPPRFVVVGTGSIGRRHVANLRRLEPDADITVVKLSAPIDGLTPPPGSDRLVGSLEAACALSPTAAIIAGPATMHLAEARLLAEAGSHLMVEKPIAARPEGVGALIELCRARGLTLMVGYCLRFLPALVTLRELVGTGVLGRVLSVRAEVGQYLPDWRPATDYRSCVSARAALGGGALLELSHEIDYVRWLLGEPEWVSATSGKLSDLEMDVEDSAELVLGFPGRDGAPGPRATLLLDMFQRAPTRQCKVVGSEGTAVMDGIAGSVRLFTTATGAWRPVDVPAMPDRNDLYLTELRHFLDCARSGGAPMVDGVDALKTLAVAEAARLSAAAGRVHDVADVLRSASACLAPIASA